MEINSLVIQVKSDGITKATQDLNDLSKAAEKAEASTSKLGDSAKESTKKQVDASQALWDSLTDKVSKARERDYNDLQRHNNRMYGLVQADANRMNALFDARKAAEQSQNEALDVIRYKARSKQAADERAQNEALDVIRWKARGKQTADLQAQNEALDVIRYKESQKALAQLQAQIEAEDVLHYKARVKQEAEAAAFAERQLVLNASFAAKSAASQARLVNEAMNYGLGGGDVAARYGSSAATLATAEGYAMLKKAADEAAHATHKFSLANAASTRELMVLSHELAQGNFKRFGGSMMVLSNQSGAFVAAVRAIGIEGVAAFAALGLAVVGAVYEMGKGLVEANNFEKSLVLTGNAAGMTRDSLNDMSKVLANDVTGGADKAKGVLEGLAGTGRFTQEAMQTVAQSVLEFMHLSGESEEKAIKFFEGMTDGVAKWAAKANESYHFLSYAQYAHIDLLEKQNQKNEAIIETSGLFNKAMDDQNRKVGALVQWYREWGVAIDKIKGFFKSVGAGNTVGEDLTAAADKALVTQKIIQNIEALPFNRRDNDVLSKAKADFVTQMAEVNRLREKYRQDNLKATRQSADDELQAQAIAADREAKLMDKRMRTKEEKRLDTMAENEATRVAINAGVLSTELAKRGVYYSEISKQAKEADANEVAQIKLSGKERVSARDNEFQLQQQLAEKYGIKLVTDAKRLEEQKAAIAKEYADPKGPADDPRSKALQGALSAIDREVQAQKKAEQDKLEQIKLGAKAKEFTEEEAAEKAKQAVQATETAEVTSLNKRFNAIKDFRAKTQVERQTAANYTKETEDKITQVHEAAAAKIREIDAAEKARKQKDEDDYLKAISTKGEQEIKTLETSVAAAQKYAREVGKTQEEIQAIRANEAAVAAQRDIDRKAAINDALKQSEVSGFARKALEAELVILERKVELNKELATANLEGTLNAAYASLGRLSEEVYKKERVASQASLKDVMGVETAKTVFIEEERRKRLQKAVQEAQGTLEKERSRGIVDPEAVAAAEKNLERVKAKAKEVGAEIQKAFDADFKVAMFKDLSTQFDLMAKSVLSVSNNLKNVSEGLAGFGKAFKELAAAQEQENKGDADAMANKIGAYGSMADAASNFFDKQSNGYAGLQKISQSFHLAQLAMNAAEMASNIPVAFSKAAAQMGPWGIAAMAAAFASVGIFSGGSHVDVAKERQQSQGTGSVFGDVNAKTDSIAKSLTILKDNSNDALPISQGMLTALNNIQSGVGALGNLLIQNGTLSTNIPADTLGTAASLGKSLGDVFSPLLGKFVGNILGRVGNAIFGGNTTTLDTGFTAASASLSSILANGFNASQYTDTKTDGGLFHSDKYNTTSASLGSDANSQFTLILSNFAKGIADAGSLLGVNSRDFTAKLNNFVVNIGSVSLKGMTGDQVQKTLEAVFSKVGDDMAKFAFGGLENFQQVGEGYFQTLVRVANGIEASQQALDKLGITAIKYTDILNKQGDVATEIVRDSILAKEGSNDVANIISAFTGSLSDLTTVYNTLLGIRKSLKDVGIKGDVSTAMIQGAGGTKELTSSLSTYYDKFFSDTEKQSIMTANLADSFGKLGIRMPASIEAFRSLVDSIGTATPEAAKLTGQVLNLADAFSQIHANDVQAVKDAGNALLSDVDSAFSVLQNVVQREQAAINTRISAEKELVDSLKSTLDSMTAVGDVAAEMNARVAAEAKISAALASVKAGGALPSADSLKDALGVVSKDNSAQFTSMQDYLEDFYKTKNSIAELNGLAGNSLSTDQKQLDTLNNMLTSAQKQIDLLKGIDTSGMNSVQALEAVRLAILSAQNNPYASSAGAISSEYQKVLGRQADQGGMQYWQDQVANGTSISDVLKSIDNSPEAQIQGLYKSVLGRSADAGGLDYWLGQMSNGMSTDAIKSLMMHSSEYLTNVPHFADGGLHSGGIRLVGEDGPELEATGPSRIINNRELMAGMMGNNNSDSEQALLTELQALRAEVAELRRTNSNENYYIAKYGKNVSDHMDNNVYGQVPFVTHAV